MPLWSRSLCCAVGTRALGTQVQVRVPVPSSQHLGKVNGVVGGVLAEDFTVAVDEHGARASGAYVDAEKHEGTPEVEEQKL